MKETREASLTEQADFILKTSPKLNPALRGRLAAVQVCVSKVVLNLLSPTLEPI
jgi:predicted component of type VI protein secretion system